MSMISLVFIGFVVIVYILLYLNNKYFLDESKNIRVSNWILLIASYLFIIYADWRFALILLIISLSSWYCAMHRNSLIGVLIPLAALAVFKYTNFFISSFSTIIGADPIALNIILPLGISFYSFSAISYVVDVKKGKTTPNSLKDVALFLSYFPKLTSGPIQKSEDFFKQISKKRSVGWNTFSPGVQIFVFGLFKKIVLADRLSVFVNQVYKTPMAFGSFTVLGAAFAYSLQIYFDFSGYSDMAIGVSKIFGINLPRNFNLPYLSHNVTEFWKRWHITLSSWLQEYLYINLGGNRKGKLQTYINLILTMVLGGIWHGANWTFIVWGLIHGIALDVHKVWMIITKSNKKEPSVIGSIFSTIITFTFVSFCWIFFRADSISQAFMIIGRILSFEPGLEHPYLWLFVSIIIYIIASIIAGLKSKDPGNEKKESNICKIKGFYPIANLSTFWGLVFFFVFCGLIICFAYTGGSPFIYGQY